ncbi:MAG: DUF2807 domain-containing protein [Flavobacteriales bacterium]|nr:DUF2807 domain-containing protein [Flavobacteriales bacterium]
MKKSLFLIALLITSTVSFSQKKEKVKGSKIVTIERKQIESFDALEVSDNLEIFLVKGSENSIEVEADDNLHQAIDIVLNGSTLRLSTLKDITSYKKLSLRVTYTDTFRSIYAKNESQITALSDLELENITLKCIDYSKAFINAKTTNFEMQCDDKSKVELNLKSQKTTISLSKNSNLKALITSTDLIFDMYQKSAATIEGDIENMKLRLDNNANFTGSKLATNIAEVTTEAYTNAAVNVKNTLTLSASAKSEVELYGDQKIIITRFEDSAVLKKKPTK